LGHEPEWSSRPNKFVFNFRASPLFFLASACRFRAQLPRIPSSHRFRAKTLTSSHTQLAIVKFKIPLRNQLPRIPFLALKKTSSHRFRALLEPLPRPYRDGGSRTTPVLRTGVPRIKMRGSTEHRAMENCDHGSIVQQAYLNRGGFLVRRWRCSMCNQTFTSREMGRNPRALGTNPRARNKRHRKRRPKKTT